MSSIGDSGLYAYLSERNYPALKENVKLINLKKGALVYDTTIRYTGIFELITGVVKLGGTSDKGEDYIYEIVVPGEFFGNLAVLGGDNRFREFSRTLSPVALRSYKADFFKHLRTHEPEVAEWAFTKIVYRWNKTESMLARIRSFEPRERIIQLYTQLHQKVIAPNNREVSLHKMVSKKDIADLTATTRQLVADTVK